jgi:Ribbon-helix-helix protein, copG family
MVGSSSATLQMVKREPTSLNIDPELWREVRKTAIDMGITATEFFEQALREKLAKVKK